MSTNWTQLKASAVGEFANPLDMLANLDRAIKMCLDGYEQEKSTVKGDVVSVTEVMPGSVANLVRTQIEVLKYIDSQQPIGESVGECRLVIGEWMNVDN